MAPLVGHSNSDCVPSGKKTSRSGQRRRKRNRKEEGEDIPTQKNFSSEKNNKETSSGAKEPQSSTFYRDSKLRVGHSNPDCVPSGKKTSRSGQRKRNRKEEGEDIPTQKNVSSEKNNKETSSGAEEPQSSTFYSDSKLRVAHSDSDCVPSGKKTSRSGQRKRKRNKQEEGEDVPTQKDFSAEKYNKETSSGADEPQSSTFYSDSKLKEEFMRKYVHLGCLGVGGYGSVYAGYRTEDNLPVAIKYVPIDTVEIATMMMNGAKKTFPVEVLMMLMAGTVKNGELRSFSVPLLEWYELQDELVLVMGRPIPSKDLYDHIMDNGGQIKEDKGKDIFRQLIECIISIHSKGVLHRDIKPENILVQTVPEGLCLHVLDFGCACALQERAYTDFCGTPDYTPPEWYWSRSYQAEPYTVWQVGVTLYVMLCGQFPFSNSRQVDSEKLYIPSHMLSKECGDLLQRCLAKRPEDRPTLDDLLKHPWLTHTEAAHLV